MIYSVSFASYESRVKQINDYINKNQSRTIKANSLDIPEYKGDILNYERLSKIRNIFNLKHDLPFEKKNIIVSKRVHTRTQTKKLKPIIVPKPLQKIMDTRKTELQNYSVSTFSLDGVVYQNKKKWGVVKVPEIFEPVYVKRGQLIGTKYGKIVEITKEGISVQEWVLSSKDRVWEQVIAVIH
jgi:type IV pilus assembly protein PilP